MSEPAKKYLKTDKDEKDLLKFPLAIVPFSDDGFFKHALVRLTDDGLADDERDMLKKLVLYMDVKFEDQVEKMPDIVALFWYCLCWKDDHPDEDEEDKPELVNKIVINTKPWKVFTKASEFAKYTRDNRVMVLLVDEWV
jgi:hypothetical protein